MDTTKRSINLQLLRKSFKRIDKWKLCLGLLLKLINRINKTLQNQQLHGKI